MTTIAYRDGVMAADSAVITGHQTRVARVRKVHRCPDGTLIGGAGAAWAIQAVWAWFDKGEPEDERPEFETEEEELLNLLIVRPDGRVTRMDDTRGEYQVEGEYHALGAGDEGALCAMAAGASAVEAIEIVARFNLYTGLPVFSEALHPEGIARIAGWHP